MGRRTNVLFFVLIAVFIIGCGGRVYLPITYFVPPSTANDNSSKASFRHEVYGGIIGAQFEDETGYMFGMQSGIYATGEWVRGGLWLNGWYGQYLFAENTPTWKQVPGFQVQGLLALAPIIHEDESDIKRLEVGLWGGFGMEGKEESYSKYDPRTGYVESGTRMQFFPLPTGGVALGYQTIHENWSFMVRYYIGLGGGLAFAFRHNQRIEVGLSTQILAFTIRPDMPPARLSVAIWID